MTPAQILAVVAMYEERFLRENIPQRRMDEDQALSGMSDFAKLAHAHWLITGIREYIASPDPTIREKAHRHLGFLQAILSQVDGLTLEKLMAHNAPSSPARSDPAEPRDGRPYERTHEHDHPYKSH